MAQYHVNLAFTADTAKAKAQMQELQKQLTNLINSPQTHLNIEGDLQGAVKAAAELKSHLQAATNIRTGNLDFAKLNQSITQSGKTLDQYATQLRSLGPAGQQAFMTLANSVANAEIPIKRTNALLEKFKDTMANTIRWQISSNIMHGFEGALQSAYGYAQDLNESLNNIRIVTGQNTDQMATFAREANKAAKALSTTTTDYTNASLIYYQQGLTDQEVKERTDITVKMANVARASAQDVSDQLTAVWNNFYDGTKTLEYYADVMTALGAATASSTDEISEGLNKFAAVAETVGLSYDYAAAALATVTATTRESADVVGNAFKTLFARIQGLKLGETLEDGTTLNKYSQALDDVGINIKTVNGDIKDMDIILNELGAKWDTLAKDQQIALAQTVAGVRQYTQLIALMDNWDYFQENLGVVADSEGALQAQADIYAESWEAAQDRVTAAAQGIYDSLINDDFFIDLLNNLEKVLTFVDNLIDGLGGLKGVLTSLGVLITKVMSDQLAQGLTNMVYNIKMSTEAGRNAIRKEREDFLRQAAEDMHQEDDDLAPIERLRSEQMQDQIKLQASLTEKAEQMSVFELTTNQHLLDRVKILSDANVKAQESLELAKAQKAATVEDIRTSMTSRWMGTYGGSDDVANQTGLNNLYTNFGIQEKNLEQIAKIRSIFDFVQTSGKLTTEQIQAMNVAFGQVQGTSHTTLKGIFDGLTAIDVPGDELNNSLDNIRIAFNLLFSEVQQKLTGTNLGFELTNEQFNELYQNILRTEVTQQRATGANKQYKDGVDGLNKSINNAKGAQKQWADYIVASANAIFGLLTVANSWGGIVDTLSNPDISGWEKFTTILSTIAILIPTLVSAWGSLKEVFNLETVAKLANTAATWAQVQAETELARKKEQSGDATDDNTNKTKKNTIEKLKDAFNDRKQKRTDAWNEAAFNKNFKEITEGDRKGQYLDLVKGGYVKDKESAKLIAGERAAGALKGMISGIALITAAIAVVGVTIAGVTAYLNKEKEAADRASKSAQTLAQTYTDVKNEYNNLLSSIENYRNAADSINTLAKGTEEFKNAIMEANDQALELINTYDELAGQYTITADGLIQFNEGVLDNIANLRRQQVLTAQSASIAANAVAKERNLEYERTEFNRNTYSTGDIGIGAVNTTATGFIGAGAGALAGVGVAAIAAKIGGAIGTAITPGIGTAVGAGIGAAVGLIAGAVTSGIEGSETPGEKQAISYLAELSKREGQEDLWTAENLRTALENIEADPALINSLTEDISATRALVEAVNANTEAQMAFTQLLVGNALAGTSAYDSSDYKDLMSYYGANDVKNTFYDRASGQIDAYTDWWWGNGDFWNEYLRLQYGADAQNYKVTNTWGNEATLMQKTADGWIEVGKVYEDVAREQAKNLKAAEMTTGMSGQYAERADTLISNLEALGLSNENGDLQKIGLAFERGQDIDLSSYSRSEIEALQANLNNASGDYTSLSGTQLTTELQEAINDWAENKAIANIKASSEWMKKYEASESADLQKVLADAGMDEKGFKAFAKQYAQFGDQAEDIAKKVLKTSNAVHSLSETFEDNEEALKKENEGTAAYAQAIGTLQGTLEEWLGVDLGYEYVAENLDTIRKAAEGDTEALKQLQLQAAREIVVQMDLPEDQALQFNNFIDQMAAKDITIGTSIEDVDTSGFIASMNEMLRTGQITAEQANRYLNSIGYDPDIDYDTITQENTTKWKFDGPFGTSLSGTFTTYSDLQIPIINAEGTKYTGGANTVTPAMAKDTSSGGGGNKSKKDTKGIDSEIERYHEIKEVLSDVERELNAISKAKDRAFGKSKLDLIDAEIAKTKENIAAQEEYLRQINEKFAADRDVILKQYGASTDSAGRITNYDEMYQNSINTYNKAVEEYNKGNMSDEQFEEYEKAFERFVNDIDQYEKTLNLLEEEQQNFINLQNEIIDLSLEKVEYEVEFKIKIEDAELQYLEYQFENLDDTIEDVAEKLVILGKQVESNLDKIAIYEEGINKAFADVLNANQLNALLQGDFSVVEGLTLTENQVTALENWRDALYENNAALKEIRATMQEEVINAFELANEEIDKTAETVDHLSSVLQSYRNIIDLIGKDTLGISDEIMTNLNRAIVKSSQDALRIAKETYDMNQKALADTQAERAKAEAEGREADVKMWDETIEVIESKVRDSESTMLDLWSATLEDAANAFEDAVDQAIASFEKALSGSFGSFDKLSTAFDQQNEIRDRYLDDYQKIYELNKLMRDISNSIDETSNVKAKRELRDLEQEIQAIYESEAEISQYQADYMRKQYELRLAQIALEEAQNAKSQVRMQRDSEGNYSYVFTANETEINNAQQNYEDKLYEMQTLIQEHIQEMQEGAIQAQQDMMDAIQSLREEDFESEEAYQAEVTRIIDYYTGMRSYYLDQLNIGISNSKTVYHEDWLAYSEKTGYKMSKDEEWVDSFDETVYSITSGFITLEEAQRIFNEQSTLLIATLTGAYHQWREDVQLDNEIIGTSMETLGTDVVNMASIIITKTGEAATSAETMATKMETAFSNILTDVTTWQSSYSGEIDKAISKNNALITSINAAIAAASQTPTNYTPPSNNNGGYSGSGDGVTDGNVNKVPGSGDGENKDIQSSTIIDNSSTIEEEKEEKQPEIKQPVTDDDPPFEIGDKIASKEQRQDGGINMVRPWLVAGFDKNYKPNKFKKHNANWAWGSDLEGAIIKGGPYAASDGIYYYVKYGSQYAYFREAQLTKYDTGGYTGQWGTDGRLAMLHQKELVLNAQDTENMLSAVNIIRDIARVIDLNAASSANAFGMLSAHLITDSGQTIQQEVTIHAEFPNATDHNEIEEAFNTLINQASQFANRKNL